MPHQRSCQRKLGELTLVSEELPPPHTERGPRQRIVSAVLDAETMLAKIREVRDACSPDRGFVRIKLAGYYETSAPPSFALHVMDTNSHGYDDRGYQTAGRLKSGASYKRPPQDFCPTGHVPILWGYVAFGSTHILGSLPLGVVEAAMGELERHGAEKPHQVEVRVQMVRLKPDDWTSKRTFMSWGLP